MTMLSPTATYHAELRQELGSVGRALSFQRGLVWVARGLAAGTVVVLGLVIWAWIRGAVVGFFSTGFGPETEGADVVDVPVERRPDCAFAIVENTTIEISSRSCRLRQVLISCSGILSPFRLANIGCAGTCSVLVWLCVSWRLRVFA